MRAFVVVVVACLAFLGGLYLGRSWNSNAGEGATQNTSPAEDAATDNPTSDTVLGERGIREATADEKAPRADDALADERVKSADLARQLQELQRRKRDDAVALSHLDEPRHWLERLLPSKFAGLTATELKHMRELDLSSSKLDVHDLAHLSQLPVLRWLTLRRTAVDDTSLTYLMRVPSLVRLGLRETRVTDAGMPTLGGMKRLEHLDLNMLPVTDKGLEHLRGLSSLKFLRLNYTKIGDAGLQHVAQLRALERLDLWGTRVTDKGLDQLWHLPALNHLELGATVVSKDWVERFTRDHPKCYVRSRHGR